MSTGSVVLPAPTRPVASALGPAARRRSVVRRGSAWCARRSRRPVLGGFACPPRWSGEPRWDPVRRGRSAKVTALVARVGVTLGAARTRAARTRTAPLGRRRRRAGSARAERGRGPRRVGSAERRRAVSSPTTWGPADPTPTAPLGCACRSLAPCVAPSLAASRAPAAPSPRASSPAGMSRMAARSFARALRCSRSRRSARSGRSAPRMSSAVAACAASPTESGAAPIGAAPMRTAEIARSRASRRRMTPHPPCDARGSSRPSAS